MLRHHLRTRKMMKVKMRVLMKMTPMHTGDVVVTPGAGELVVDGVVVKGEEGGADAQLDKEAQDRRSLTSDADVDVDKCTEVPDATRDPCRQDRLLIPILVATTAHNSPKNQLLMIDMVHRPALVATYVAVAEQLEASRNEASSLGAVSPSKRSHYMMMMKMNKVLTNQSLDAELAEDEVLRDVDAIQLRPETMISL